MTLEVSCEGKVNDLTGQVLGLWYFDETGKSNDQMNCLMSPDTNLVFTLTGDTPDAWDAVITYVELPLVPENFVPTQESCGILGDDCAF